MGVGWQGFRQCLQFDVACAIEGVTGAPWF